MNNELEFFEPKSKDDKHNKPVCTKTIEYVVILAIIMISILCSINTKPITTELVTQNTSSK